MPFGVSSGRLGVLKASRRFFCFSKFPTSGMSGFVNAAVLFFSSLGCDNAGAHSLAGGTAGAQLSDIPSDSSAELASSAPQLIACYGLWAPISIGPHTIDGPYLGFLVAGHESLAPVLLHPSMSPSYSPYAPYYMALIESCNVAGLCCTLTAATPMQLTLEMCRV